MKIQKLINKCYVKKKVIDQGAVTISIDHIASFVFIFKELRSDDETDQNDAVFLLSGLLRICLTPYVANNQKISLFDEHNFAIKKR